MTLMSTWTIFMHFSIGIWSKYNSQTRSLSLLLSIINRMINSVIKFSLMFSKSSNSIQIKLNSCSIKSSNPLKSHCFVTPWKNLHHSKANNSLPCLQNNMKLYLKFWIRCNPEPKWNRSIKRKSVIHRWRLKTNLKFGKLSLKTNGIALDIVFRLLIS